MLNVSSYSPETIDMRRTRVQRAPPAQRIIGAAWFIEVVDRRSKASAIFVSVLWGPCGRLSVTDS